MLQNTDEGGKGMIISTTNTIEGMKIIKNFGYVEAKPNAMSWNTRKSARKNLEKKSEELGANAIINFKAQDLLGLGVGAFASGEAVIIEGK